MTQQAKPFSSRPTRLGDSIADCVVCDAPLTSYEVRGRGMNRLGFIVDRSQCYCYGCVSLAPKTTVELIEGCAYAREQMQGDARRHGWKGGRIGSCALLMAEAQRVIAEASDDCDWF